MYYHPIGQQVGKHDGAIDPVQHIKEIDNRGGTSHEMS